MSPLHLDIKLFIPSLIPVILKTAYQCRKWFYSYIFVCLVLFSSIASSSIAQQKSNNLECPNKDGLIRYEVSSQTQVDQGLWLYFFQGAQYVQGSFKENAYADLQTDGEFRIKGTVQAQEQDKSSQEWIIDFRFSYLPSLNNTQESYYKMSKGAKLVNKTNRNEVMTVRPLSNASDLVVEYDLKLSANDITSFDGKIHKEIVAKAVFEYQRTDGSWRQGKIEIVLNPVCEQVDPIKIISENSDKLNNYKWRIINPNQRRVHLYFVDFKGALKLIYLPSSKKGGEYELYTDKKGGKELVLNFASIPGYQFISNQVDPKYSIDQHSKQLNVDSSSPE